MERRHNSKQLRQSVELRHALLRTIAVYDLKHSQVTSSELLKYSKEYQSLAMSVADLAEHEIVTAIGECIEICAMLCLWSDAVLKAELDTDRFMRSIESRVAIVNEMLSKSRTHPVTVARLTEWINAVKQARAASVGELLQGFVRMPFPVIYSKNHDPYERSRAGVMPVKPEQRQELSPLAAKCMAFLDDLPWATPQAIQSGLHYDFKLVMDILEWPEDLPILEVDWVSTMDPASFSIPSYTIDRGDKQREYTLQGHLVVKNPQSYLSSPAVFKTRARLANAEGSVSRDLLIVGYPELRLRALNKADYPVLSSYPMVDIQIPIIMRDVVAALPELSPKDMDDFQRCLVAIGRYAGEIQQSGRFKGKKVDEVTEFQRDMLMQLRMTELGSDLREGERTAGGILDLRYHNITIELKVESEIKDREKLRRKYIEQPAQYSAALIPLSITCILDTTVKVSPPANVACNISLETPSLHGFEGQTPQFPSKVAVVIIDANLSNPSSYS